MEPILLAFITGLTTGGLSCLAVQGGLLASSIASEVEKSVQSQPAAGRRLKYGDARQSHPAQQVRAGGARPILLFLAAKMAAYTTLGLLLGWVGSVFQFTPALRAILLVAIGVFMVGSALRMLKLHPIFRFFSLEPPSSVTRYIRRKSRGQSTALTPLFLGALTVLIPCGVTQAMMAVAMGTGDPVAGATIMLAFTLGTSPVFFTVAYLATRIGSRLEKNFLRFVAVTVLILGLVAIDSALTLAGWPYSVSNLRIAAGGASSAPVADASPLQAEERAPLPNPQPSGSAGLPAPSGEAGPAPAVDGVVTINVRNDGYYPAVAHAEPDRPFELALVTEQTRSCSLAFVIPSLRIQKMLPQTGTVKIVLPPQPPGSKLFYSCSMGMYSGVIVFDS